MGFLDRWTKKTTKQQLAQGATLPATTAPAVETAPTNISSVPTAPAGGFAYRVIIRPLVTEKAASQESANKYTFVVARWANKPQVKQAVKALYGVEAVVVNLVNVQGHRVRFGRSFGRRSDYKKAIVTLPAGKSITIHEGV